MELDVTQLAQAVMRLPVAVRAEGIAEATSDSPVFVETPGFEIGRAHV